MMHLVHYVVRKLQCKSIWKFKILINVISNLIFKFENFENHKFERNFEIHLQWNLSIAEMLYSRHLSIADTSSRNQLSQATVKLLYFEPLYSKHLSIGDKFSENQLCPLFEKFHCIWKTNIDFQFSILKNFRHDWFDSCMIKI